MRHTRAILLVGLWLMAQVCGWAFEPSSDSVAKSTCCSPRTVRPACSAPCCRQAPSQHPLPAQAPAASPRAAQDGISDSIPPVVLWELPLPRSGSLSTASTASAAFTRISSEGALYLQLESLLI